MTQYISTVLSPFHYVDPAILNRELQQIFRSAWLFAGLEADISQAWATVPLGGAGFLVGCFDGRLRAHANLCAHRGVPLFEPTPIPSAGVPRCRYHGWRYDAEGAVVEAPGMASLPRCRLASASAAPWNGMAWVSTAPIQDISTSFPGFSGETASVKWAALRRHRSTRYRVASNWKLVVENYLEDIHFPTVHPELDALTPGGEAELVRGEGPWLGGVMRLTGAETVSRTGRRVARCIAPPGEVRDYLLWPNLLLSVHPDYVVTDVVWPTGASTCEVWSTWYFHADDVHDPCFDPGPVYEFWALANSQDREICEAQQRGVASLGARRAYLTAADVLVGAFGARVRAVLDPGEAHDG